jgi:oxaloacetate decarboxylase alpha subunit
MGPQEAYDLVKALTERVKVPIVLHTHSTTGLGPITCVKAIEAGCAGIDCAISSFSGGTSQPSTETLVYALKQMGYETGVSEKVLKNINDFFKPVKQKYISSGLMDSFVMGTETDALVYQVPGGMLSNLLAQLKAQNSIDRLEEVLAEIPNVRKDLGYPPLVTPMSQMVGVQAATNVLLGERYKSVSKEVKSYLRGEYGKAPGEVDKTLVKKVLGDEKPIEGRFADTLKPAFEETKKQLGDMAKNDEDVLSYIAFPQIAEKFFKEREQNSVLKVSYSIVEK